MMRLLDAAELAEILNVPVTWGREATRSNVIPHIELGRYRRYDLAAVLAWLEECKQPGRAIRLRSHDAAKAAEGGKS